MGSQENQRPKLVSSKTKTRKDNSVSKYGENNGWTMSTKVGSSKDDLHSQYAQKPMTREDQIIVHDSEDEFRRRGHFKRIFPTLDYHYYKQFFLLGERT